MSKKLDILLARIQNGEKIPPMVVSTQDAIYIVSTLKNAHIETLESLWTENIPDTTVYTREDDEKHFSIRTVRQMLADSHIRPYSGQAIYILQDIDTATGDATANALLKILEEPPEYLLILLVVSRYQDLLETVRSRTIYISSDTYTQTDIPPGMLAALDTYVHGDSTDILYLLYPWRPTRDEAISLLLHLWKKWKYTFTPAKIAYIETAIGDILTTQASARNILDMVFLQE